MAKAVPVLNPLCQIVSTVIPAKAGIQSFQYNSHPLDPGFAPPVKLWQHAVAGVTTFCEDINFDCFFTGY
jgi:hypothetical protein